MTHAHERAGEPLHAPDVPHAFLKDNLAYSMDQAAIVTGIGRSALYLAMRDGRLPVRKMGRRSVVLRHELARFLDELPRAPTAR
jgi:hypothetical protein